MRKLFSFLAVIVCLSLCSICFASVGIRNNGNMVGTATDLNFGCGNGTNATITADGSIYNINCSSTLQTTGVANGGGTSLATIDTGIPLTYAIVKKAISNVGTSTDTLANGTPGQMLTLFITSDTGSGTWRVTPTTSYGWSQVTFTAALQGLSLLYLDDTNGWMIISTYSSGSTAAPTVVAK